MTKGPSFYDNPGPDQGWSWIVALASCFLLFGTQGVARSSGVIYVAMVNTFGISRQEGSWPFSLSPAVACFSSIFAGMMSRFMSTRQTAFCGTLLCVLGLGLCFFANTIAWFTVCYGVVFGLGLALIVPGSLSTLNEFFTKKRAMANGIFFSGSTFGLLLLPSLLEYLVEEYGLKGTLLLEAGLVANVLIATLLFRPRNGANFPVLALRKNPFVREGPEGKVLLRLNSETGSFKVEREECETSSRLEARNNNERNIYKALNTKDNEESMISDSENRQSRKQRPSIVTFKGVEKRDSVVSMSVGDVVRQSLGGSITMVHSIGTLPIVEGSPKPSTYFTIVRDLLFNPYYHMIVVSGIACIIPLLTFMIIIMDFGIDRGLPKDKAVFLMSIISIPELLGRIIFGYFTDKISVQYKTSFMISKFVAGLILFALPHVTNEIGLFILAGMFGMVESCAIIILNCLFVEYLGLEKLTIAFSWSFFVNGFIFLAMPYLIGLFRDTIGSYDYLFYLLGTLCILATILWLIEPYVVRRRKAKLEKEELERERSDKNLEI